VLLALSVISHQSRRLGASSYRVFDEHGGSIGRGDGNDWVLEDPDSLLSGRHAIVRANKGSFLIVDVSTNGTGLNSPDALVPHGVAVPLSEGDRLFLGDFEILVQVIQQIEPPVATAAALTKVISAVPAMVGPSATSELTTDLLVPVPVPIAAQIVPTAVKPSSHALPSGENLAPSAGAAAVAVPERAQPESVPDVDADLSALLHVVTQGVIDALGTRTTFKSQFRMALTHVRPEENNPLKFTDSADQALHTLLVERNPGYLGAIASFSQAFDDLEHHQTSIAEGMKAGYLAVLKCFDPDRIEADCDDAGAPAGLFNRTARNRYWSHFRAFYARLKQDSDGGYLDLFGEAFVRAYDEHLRHLEAAAHVKTSL
jgi:predicted component of type VI protein secretion system